MLHVGPCRKVFTADEVADIVVGILDKLGVKEACVVGHSYGACMQSCRSDRMFRIVPS